MSHMLPRLIRPGTPTAVTPALGDELSGRNSFRVHRAEPGRPEVTSQRKAGCHLRQKALAPQAEAHTQGSSAAPAPGTCDSGQRGQEVLRGQEVVGGRSKVVGGAQRPEPQPCPVASALVAGCSEAAGPLPCFPPAWAEPETELHFMVSAPPWPV